MRVDRRTLLRGLGAGAALAAFRADAMARVGEAARAAAGKTPSALAGDEAYWFEIAQAFDVDRTLVNLNNGGCSPAPAHVLNAMIQDLRFSNEIPVYHMWTVLEPRIEIAAGGSSRPSSAATPKRWRSRATPPSRSRPSSSAST